MASSFGSGEIENVTRHLGSDKVEVQLADRTKLDMHPDILDRFQTGTVHGSFGALGFETEFDRKRRERENTNG